MNRNASQHNQAFYGIELWCTPTLNNNWTPPKEYPVIVHTRNDELIEEVLRLKREAAYAELKAMRDAEQAGYRAQEGVTIDGVTKSTYGAH